METQKEVEWKLLTSQIGAILGKGGHSVGLHGSWPNLAALSGYPVRNVHLFEVFGLIEEPPSKWSILTDLQEWCFLFRGKEWRTEFSS